MEPRPKETERFNITVRPVEEKDIPTLRPISEHWLQDDGVIAEDEVEGDLETLRQSLNEDSPKKMFVAETPEGRVVGMMGVNLQPKKELLRFAQTDKPSELIVAYVHPDFTKRHGVGTALINHAQMLAREKGKAEMLLESGPRHRETGYPFYDKQPGFICVGKIPDFYGSGLDTVVWQKTF